MLVHIFGVWNVKVYDWIKWIVIAWSVCVRQNMVFRQHLLCLPLMTWTLATSNLALTRTKVDFPWIFFYTFTVSLSLVTQSNFCFPADHFHFLTPNNWNNVLSVWQVEKKMFCSLKHLIYFKLCCFNSFSRISF